MKTDFFNDLIQLERTHSYANEYGFNLNINPANSIFEGHFPNMPILPGVVMMEVIKRATSLVVNQKLCLQQSKSVKFLKLIEPNLISNFDLKLSIETTQEEYAVRAEVSNNGEIYYKQIANFKENPLF